MKVTGLYENDGSKMESAVSVSLSRRGRASTEREHHVILDQLTVMAGAGFNYCAIYRIFDCLAVERWKTILQLVDFVRYFPISWPE